MATREVATAINYAITVSPKGVKEAVALTRDLASSSKTTQTAVDTSMRAVQAQYKALETVAIKAQGSVEKAAVSAAVGVNKALDAQVARMREAEVSYTAIIGKQAQLGVSAASLAAAIERVSQREIAAMRATSAEAAKAAEQTAAANRARGDAVTRSYRDAQAAQAAQSSLATDAAVAASARSRPGLSGRISGAGKSISAAGHQLSGLSVPLLGAAAASIKEAVDFQTQMTLIQTQAGASAAEVKRLSAEVLKLAPAAGTGPAELAKALFPIESVGIRGAKAMELLKVAAEGAHVGHADLATTTDVLVGALKTADLRIHGVAATMGALNAIVGGGKLHMEDLTQALTTGVLPAAKGIGLGLRDVGAGLDVMTARGVPAIDAATRLKMLFVSLATGSKQASDALAVIGLSHDKLATAMRGPQGLGGAVALLNAHLAGSGLSKNQQIGLLAQVTGRRSLAPALTLLQNSSELTHRTTALGAAGSEKGFASAVSVEAATAGHKLELLQASLKTAGVGLGTAILPIATKVAKALADVARAFNDLPGPVKKAIGVVALVIGVLGPLGILIGGVTTAIGVLGAAMKLAFANPIVLLITAIAVAAFLIYKNWKPISKFFEDAWKTIKGAFSDGLNWIKGHWELLTAIMLGPIGLVIVGVKEFGPSVLHWITTAFDDVVKFIESLPGKFLDLGKSLINGLIDGIKSAPGAIVDALVSLLPGPLQGPLKSLLGLGGGGTVAATPVATSNSGAPRHGGTFATGGLVPAMVSPGEMVIHGGMSAMVPGPRTAADSVFAMLPAGAAVMTGSGQAMMGMGVSLDDALALQLPHFGGGGTTSFTDPTGKGRSGGRGRGHGGRQGGPKLRYFHHQPVGVMDEAHWQAYQLQHGSHTRSGSAALNHYGIPGLVGLAEGGGFSGENAAIAAAIAEAESGGDVHSVNTAGNSPPSRDRGLWQFNDYWNKNISDATAFDPFAAAKAAYQTFRSRGFRDWVTYNQGQYRRFLPAAEAALHSGVAPITSGTPQGVLQAAARAKVGIPTLSNAAASLTGQTAFAGGFQAGLSGLNLMDTVHSGILSQLLGDVAVTKSSSSPTGVSSVASVAGPRSGSYVFPLPDFGSEQRVDRGQDMESKRPYANTVALGSGTVTSATIGWPGMRLLLDSGAYKGQTVFYGHNNAIHAKLGQHLRAGQLIGQVGNLSGGGDSRHTEIGFMGGYNSQSGHWVGPGSSGGMLMHRLLHQMAPQWIGAKAMRRGGVVGKHRHPAPLNSITGANTKIGALLAQGDAANVDAAFTALAGSLDDAASFTQASLLALAQKVHSHSRKGLDTIQQRRLDTVMNLIDAALGNRVGLLIASAQDAVDTIARGNAHKVALSTLSGVDPGSTKGLQLAVQLDQAVLSGLNAQVGVLQRAKETAKKYGDKATIKTVTDELNTALGNLDQAAVQAMNDWKASVERATQDAVDSASQAVSVAQAGEGILSLQQQLAGTDQTPGGGQATSAYISSTVIPALQAQLAAQQADQAAAASVGDTARVNQDILSELQTQTSILSEQKTAQDAIKVNTTPLKTFGGQLAFQFQGSNFTDLAALAPGS